MTAAHRGVRIFADRLHIREPWIRVPQPMQRNEGCRPTDSVPSNRAIQTLVCISLLVGIHQCRLKELPWRFPSESHQGTLLPWGISHFLGVVWAADVALFNRIVTNVHHPLQGFLPPRLSQTIQYKTTWTWISITRQIKFNSREKLLYSHFLFSITLSSLVKVELYLPACNL